MESYSSRGNNLYFSLGSCCADLQEGTATIHVGTLIVEPNTVLSGPGTLFGNLVNSGSVLPSLGSGESLAVLGDYSQTPGAVLRPELSRDGVTLIDRLSVSGTAHLAGGFSIGEEAAFNPSSGESFAFIQAGAIEGEFDTIVLPPLADGNHYAADQSSTTFRIQVIAPPTISVDDVEIIRQLNQVAAAIFTVRLSHAPIQPVTVHYATRAGTATAPADYAGSAGILSFAANNAQAKTVTIPITAQRRSPHRAVLPRSLLGRWRHDCRRVRSGRLVSGDCRGAADSDDRRCDCHSGAE